VIEYLHPYSVQSPMLPTSLALVDDDIEYTEFLQQDLVARGVRVDVYGDSNDLLTSALAFDYDFYVLDLGLPGIDGLDLIKLLRRRTQKGVLVVSGRLGSDVFEQVLRAGADMYLTKPVRFEQVAIAMESVYRRIQPPKTSTASHWTVDTWARKLMAPDGAAVDLSETDVALLKCFASANGEVVTREALKASLAQLPGYEAQDGLSATIFRLRRRIEKATPAALPLQTKSRVGYVFSAPLQLRSLSVVGALQ
jgi:two-component system, OmpR family, response regulator